MMKDVVTSYRKKNEDGLIQPVWEKKRARGSKMQEVRASGGCQDQKQQNGGHFQNLKAQMRQ